MRHVDRGPCPDDLDPVNPCDAVRAERAKAAARFAGVPLGDSTNPREHVFDFTQHRLAAERLDEVFNGKCAFCEALLEVSADLEVEHFRPKGAVSIDGKNRKPGYHWLATSWDNVTPCCPVCNKRREREVEDAQRATRGKGTLFPLADEAKRARHPGDEAHETPTLLNPCDERRPERFFRFDRDGLIRANPACTPFEQDVARTTIEVFGLDRDRLRRARGAAIQSALVHVSHLGECVDDWLRSPTDEQARVFEQRVETSLRALVRCTLPTEPFSVAVRQVVLAELSALVGMPVPSSLFDEGTP